MGTCCRTTLVIALLAIAMALQGPSAAGAATPSFDDVMKDPNRKVGFIRKTLKLDDGTQRIYQVWVPLDYTPDRKWPTILFLHGAGECGTDGEKVLVQGLPKEIKKRQGKFDFIVVIPQCSSFRLDKEGPEAPEGERPKRRGGWVGKEEQVALAALAATQKEYSCDPDRLYLTGLSMGGFGTFSIAMKYPRKFAAIVPICGGGDLSHAADIAHLPIWIWHGADDKTVPVENSRKMTDALKATGAQQVKYTELPGVGHNSWDNAYASDDLWKWLLEQKRSTPRPDETARQAEPDDPNRPKRMAERMRPMDGKMTPMDGKMEPMTGRMHPIEGRMEPIRPKQ